MNDLEQYLNVLFEGLEGYVYSPLKTSSNWEQNWFEYPTQRDDLIAHIQKGGGDVYISPAIYSERRATKDAIKRSQTVWVEFDGSERIDFREIAQPTLIVQTSSTSHVHCYWRTNPISLTTIENVNRRLTHYLHADHSGWDATQVLRPPGTVNYKHNLPVQLVHASNSSYALELFDFVPEVAAPPIETVTVKDLLLPAKLIASLPLKLVRMIKLEEPVEPYRSSFLARLANELAEEGQGHLEIVSLLKVADDRIKKYSGRADQLLRLSQLADYAIHKQFAEEEVQIWTAQGILDFVDDLRWVIPQWLHTTGQLMLSSAPGVGKTQFVLQLAYCLEHSIRFLGMKSETKHKVFVLSLEMDKSGLKYIFNHQKNEWNEGSPAFSILEEPSSLVVYENQISKLEPTVIIIDSLSELFDDSHDNANAEARRLMRWCRKIRRRYGVAIILIHHNRKATEGNKKPKALSDLAGSFFFGKDSDTVVQLWEDAKGIELSLPKVRYGPKQTFMIERNENFWFTRKNDEGRATRTTRTDPPRNPTDEATSSGRGDKLHGGSISKVNFGFGPNDG